MDKNDLKYNGDGSITLYMGPVKRYDFNQNWIKTKAGEDFFAIIRFYFPTKAYYDGTWKTNHIQRLD